MKAFSRKRAFKLINILKGTIICALFSALVYFSISRPRILVLHSYTEDFPWVNDFNTAFKVTLQHPLNPVVYYSYMNTLDKESLRYKMRAGQESLEMIDNIQPDIILSIFSEANEFAVQKYLNDPHIQIIYNLHSDPAQFKYDTGNNTQGVQGILPLKGINDLLLLSNPKRPLRIVHIADLSAKPDTFITSYPWQDIILEDSILVSTFEEWKKAVQSLSEDVDYIIVSKYAGLIDTQSPDDMIASKIVMEWTAKNSKVPIIGLSTSATEEGADFSMEDSPFEQGAMMAQMVGTLLDKKSITPKMQTNKHFVVFNKKDSRIALPEVYKSFSTAFEMRNIYKKKEQ